MQYNLLNFPYDFPLKVSLQKIAGEERDWHKTLKIMYLLEGDCTYYQDNEAVELHASDIIAINPFIIYEWLYKGVKPDNKLQVVVLDDIPNNILLDAIYNAKDSNSLLNVEQDLIDDKHFRIWQAAKNDYIEYSKQIIGYKLENLSTSYKSRIRAIKDRLVNETDARIIRMKESQLASIKLTFEEKQKELNNFIAQSDIVIRKLAIGVIKVVN